MLAVRLGCPGEATEALAGGRVNYHPLYPLKATRAWRTGGLLTGKLMLANSRLRLLNFITKAPVDSPVAVVFGHACAMNWAGPSYDDVGLGLTNSLTVLIVGQMLNWFEFPLNYQVVFIGSAVAAGVLLALL